MQPPLEDRVTSVETAAERHEQHMARLDAMLARMDAQIADHDQLFDRILALEESLQSKQESLESTQAAMASLLEELARDAAVTRRLWFRLAQRYGWLDDEQNGAQPDTPA